MCVRVSQSLKIFDDFRQKFPIDFEYRYHPESVAEDVTAFKQRLTIIATLPSEVQNSYFITSCDWGQDDFFNARYDSLKFKRFWSDSNRVLVPVSGFYERGRWFKANPEKAEFFVIGGVTKETPDHHHKAFVVTRPSDRPVSFVHSRMPFIVPEYLWEDWLDPDIQISRFDKLHKSHFDLIAA
jgi:putative SOS response-associated peptidase YedK